ncbi:uncharacterized protein Pyn_08477 [Prunus yedoensis var. nudiflora]|uniref:Uncharacterized protein n=1 Tax=Prunus yedoensis var. nudiflora TaxID=2094558 RepID=A0A314XSA1_PRUYE|nr:uncharacterized protein Pyn_07499 [Prunus yedoensis var. nudiflora]PQQ08222.1 uncharacterized protein Pyn_08477 [Prunus yedoensis var. nudiflora]
MDASVLRAVLLMSMLVLAIAQAEMNPSYTNTVPNGNTLGQLDDVSDPSDGNQVVPNGHIISCDANIDLRMLCIIVHIIVPTPLPPQALPILVMICQN